MRICAHRGFPAIAPENSLPAYGAAVALGADEIEFDLWASSDGVIVSCHDAYLSRCSDGTGRIWEHTFEELRSLDFGSKFSPELAGLQIPTYEEILENFAGRVTLATHVKDPDNVSPLPESTLREIARLLRKYSVAESSYFICGNNALLEQLAEMIPEVPRCIIHGNDPMEDIIEKAKRHGASRIALFPPYFKHYDAEYVPRTVAAAHALGLPVNIDCDDAELARQYAAWGVDTICTNRMFAMKKLFG